MIKERYQFQARRLDNGNDIIGSVLQLSGYEPRYFIYSIDVANEMPSDYYDIMQCIFEIDPSTIEPVAVAPIHLLSGSENDKIKCPNCDMYLMNDERGDCLKIPCCANCGQRLDWSGRNI